MNRLSANYADREQHIYEHDRPGARALRARLGILPSLIGLSAALCLLLSAGCNLHADLDDVRLHGTIQDGIDDPDSGDIADSSETPDSGEAPDIAHDGYEADADQDSGPPLEDALDDPDGSARECSHDMGPIVGDCRPSRPDDCGSNSTCRLQLSYGSSKFRAYCASVPSGREARRLKSEGESCSSGSDCVAGLDCTLWDDEAEEGLTCQKLCELESGAGCDLEKEFCSNPAPELLTGLGFCVKYCHSTFFNGCPSGRTCAPDPRYPQGTCHDDNMRCMPR